MKGIDIGRFSKARATFKSLLRPHLPLLHCKARALTGSAAAADALLQDVLLDLTQHVDTMKKIDNLAPWLLQVLYLKAEEWDRRPQRLAG